MRQCRVIMGEWYMGIGRPKPNRPQCPVCFARVSEPGRKCHRCAHLPFKSSKRTEAIERYKRGETSREVGVALGISHERVCQYVRAAPDVVMRSGAGWSKMTCGPSGGTLSQAERYTWRRGQKQLRRLLDHRRIVRLYKQGSGALDIQQVIPRLTAGDILDLLRQAGVAIRPVGTHDHSRGVARRRYPWDIWLDGQVRTLKHGVDFTCKPFCLRQNAYRHAKRRGKSVRVTIHGDVVTILAM